MDLGNFFAAWATTAAATLAVVVLIVAATVGLSIWLTYTIIWHAVRRGMREHYIEVHGLPAQSRRSTRGATSGLQRRPEPIRSETGPRDW
ncbi:MAG: hypothetical protein ABI435_06415 [Pseudolysinimonas sp.]